MIPLDRVRELLAAATPSPIDVHRCDADGGDIDYQLQRGAGHGGTVLGYASDRDGSPRAKADATLWSHAPDLARDVLTLAAALETAERERDEAREVAVRLGEVCERQARMLARAPSFEDAMALCIHAIVEPATDAPNCAEWRGTMRGRGFVLSLQWADGKSPQTLLSEAMAERDTARSAHAELAAAVRAEREAAVDAIVRCARTVRGLAEEIVDATTRADATEADRDYWRAQATMAAPCVDAVRALGSRLIPGGTGCAVDPERVVAAAEGLRREAALATMERDTLRALTDSMRADNVRLRGIVAAVRHERAARAAWLATLPACATAPAEVVAAEAATGAALDAAGEGR